MDKLSKFSDADVQRLTNPLMPLVEKSRGLQVLNPSYAQIRRCFCCVGHSVAVSFMCADAESVWHRIQLLLGVHRMMAPMILQI